MGPIYYSFNCLPIFLLVQKTSGLLLFPMSSKLFKIAAQSKQIRGPNFSKNGKNNQTGAQDGFLFLVQLCNRPWANTSNCLCLDRTHMKWCDNTFFIPHFINLAQSGCSLLMGYVQHHKTMTWACRQLMFALGQRLFFSQQKSKPKQSITNKQTKTGNNFLWNHCLSGCGENSKFPLKGLAMKFTLCQV